MLTVNVGLSFFGGTRMSSLSVNAADLFVLSQEVVLNQSTSEQYFSNITARLVVSAPESHHSNGIVKSVLFGTALSCKSVFFFYTLSGLCTYCESWQSSGRHKILDT